MCSIFRFMHHITLCNLVVLSAGLQCSQQIREEAVALFEEWHWLHPSATGGWQLVWTCRPAGNDSTAFVCLIPQIGAQMSSAYIVTSDVVKMARSVSDEVDASHTYCCYGACL